jgi:tripartite-type tricarboxylate transporter receptor subunit TctC
MAAAIGKARRLHQGGHAFSWEEAMGVIRFVGALAAGAACLSFGHSAAAQEATSWGKEMTIFIGSTTGGGYDQYGRLLARTMGHHLPGNPKIVPKNMPNQRQVVAHIYNIAPKDGSTIAITTRNTLFDPLFHDEDFKFDAMKLTWVGSMNSETSLCVVWHTAKAKTVEELKKTQVVFGSGGPASSDSLHARLLNEVAGTKIKIVEGYPGSTEVHLAMERGEVSGRCGLGWDSIKSRYKRWMDEKKIALVAQFALDKHPELPDVPFIMDLAKTDEHHKMASLMLGPNKMGRPIFAPPGIPADRVKALREAFAATMQDPQPQADAKKMRIELEWMSGEDEAALVKKLYATPKPIVERVRKMMGGKS